MKGMRYLLLNQKLSFKVRWGRCTGAARVARLVCPNVNPVPSLISLSPPQTRLLPPTFAHKRHSGSGYSGKVVTSVVTRTYNKLLDTMTRDLLARLTLLIRQWRPAGELQDLVFGMIAISPSAPALVRPQHALTPTYLNWYALTRNDCSASGTFHFTPSYSDRGWITLLTFFLTQPFSSTSSSSSSTPSSASPSPPSSLGTCSAESDWVWEGGLRRCGANEDRRPTVYGVAS